MQVEKRDGKLEDINIDKLHKVVAYACEGITGVSASEVEINSQIQFFESIKTEDILMNLLLLIILNLCLLETNRVKFLFLREVSILQLQ